MMKIISPEQVEERLRVGLSIYACPNEHEFSAANSEPLIPCSFCSQLAALMRGASESAGAPRATGEQTTLLRYVARPR